MLWLCNSKEDRLWSRHNSHNPNGLGLMIRSSDFDDYDIELIHASFDLMNRMITGVFWLMNTIWNDYLHPLIDEYDIEYEYLHSLIDEYDIEYEYLHSLIDEYDMEWLLASSDWRIRYRIWILAFSDWWIRYRIWILAFSDWWIRYGMITCIL